MGGVGAKASLNLINTELFGWGRVGWRGVGKASLNLKKPESSAVGTFRRQEGLGWRGGKSFIEGLDGGLVWGNQAGGFGWGVSLNLIKITELSALRAVRKQGLDGGSVWARGVVGGGKGLIESH